MPAKTKKARREEQSASPFKKIAVGAAIGAVLFFAFTAAFALASLKSGIGSGAYFPAGLIIALLSGLVAGFAAAKPIKKNGLACGALAGLCASLPCAAAAALLSSGAGVRLIAFIGAMTLGGALGGVAAGNIKKRAKY